jgi:hypothetical protein
MRQQPVENVGGSSFRGLIGVAREDITPPAGIYARCWGAAKHDVATGVHRPLTLTCLTIQSGQTDAPLVLISADLMYWQSPEDESSVRGAVLAALALDESRLMFCVSHTHSAPSLYSGDEHKPGGHLIAPYRQRLRDAAAGAVRKALGSSRDAILDWRYGSCDLACDRDFFDPHAKRFACGFNPGAPSDHTLLVGRICDHESGGRTIATIVNYACHPTTLAWENSLISPDYVGAMREVVENKTGGAPCLFLQGASGELAPAEQYVGDVRVADSHGRRLGSSVVSTLEAMPRPGARLAYKGIVESGTALGVWRQENAPVSSDVSAEKYFVELPLKPMPSMRELDERLRQCDDRVLGERLARQRSVRKNVGDGAASRMPLWTWRIGDAILVGQPNEAYSQYQVELRRRFAPRPVAVMNLVNGAYGYLPPCQRYDDDTQVYQVWQSPFDRGSLERLTDETANLLEQQHDRQQFPQST